MEEFEGLREISLSLSCPEAANLILGCEEPVHFLEAENPDREETYEEFDFFLFTKLEDARTLIFQILQNREYPVRLRMAIVLALAHDLQERIDKNALFEIDGLLKRYEKERVWTWFQEKLDNLDTEEKTQQEVCGNLFVILNHLEVLRDDWKGYVKEAKNMLLESELSAEQRKEFESVFTEKIMEQLMVYFVFTYFCGAVYDEQAYGKLKICSGRLYFDPGAGKRCIFEKWNAGVFGCCRGGTPVCKRSGAFGFQQVQNGADAAG